MNRNLLGKGWAFPVARDVTGGVRFSQYEKSIEESIRIILNTTPGERLMRPDFGCSINEIVFTPNTPRSITLAEHYVREALVKWEPRIILGEVKGEPDPDNPVAINIHISYEIRSVNTFFNMVYPFYLERGEIDKEAETAEEFLHEVRVQDGADPAVFAAVLAATEEALRRRDDFIRAAESPRKGAKAKEFVRTVQEAASGSAGAGDAAGAADDIFSRAAAKAGEFVRSIQEVAAMGTATAGDIFSRAAAAAGKPAVVIGGVNGVPLSEKGFSREVLKEKYGYGDKEAETAEEFLHEVRVQDGAGPAALAAVVSAAEAAIHRDTKRGAGSFRKNLLESLDARPDVSYNLCAHAGRRAYVQSGRFRATGFTPESLEELTAVRSVSVSAGGGVRLVEPVYKSRGGVGSFTRSVPRGSPEPVQRGYRDAGGFFKAYEAGAKKNVSRPVLPVPVRQSAGPSAGGLPSIPGAPVVWGNTQRPVSVRQAAEGAGSGAPRSGPYPAGFGETARESAANRGGGELAFPPKKGVAASSAEDAELARLRRIEANYEKDKAMLERQPALARSDSHEVGHAEGKSANVDQSDIKKMTTLFEGKLKGKVRKKLR
jgi:phage baseplate assembly protein W